LDAEDDVLQAAKELAEREGSTAGRVISASTRRGLMAPGKTTKPSQPTRRGVPLLPSRGEVVTLDHFRELLEQQGACTARGEASRDFGHL
jgi:hypothetical protein